MAPMLHDKAWKKLADKDETLCPTCFFRRAIDRNVDLKLAHLRPCSFNLDGSPSWFDLFRRDGHPGPKILNQWREAAWDGRRGLPPKLWAEL
jgi:hypothetical protein